MKPPHDYPRRILLAVTGLSPQVVTETLYALTQPPLPFIPTEIHLITTTEGARRAELSLLSEDPGWFHRLCRDYQLPSIVFSKENIHVVPGRSGFGLDDIRTPEDNVHAADFITEQVRRFTRDEHAALHVSLAGGRKTMGFYLGYALSLFGRPQDRLSHVLVSEPFESSYEFFYPTPYERILTLRDNKLADSREARVTLADIPLVSLRHDLPEALLDGHASYSDTVQAARQALAPPFLRLTQSARRVAVPDSTITLSIADFALYLLFAHRAQQGQPPIRPPAKEVPCLEWSARYLESLQACSDRWADLDRFNLALKHGMTGDYFSQRLSRLNKSLRQNLGPKAQPYLIHDGGQRPRLYALRLPTHAIEIHP